MSVVLNGNTYAITDFVGDDGQAYSQIFAATGLQTFPESIFTDMLAELASATSIDGLSPGAAGGIIVSDGAAWVRAASATITDAGAASFTALTVDHATSATFYLNETGGAADNRVWRFLANSEKLTGSAINDALSVAGDWLRVERTGTTIDSVQLIGTAIQATGVFTATSIVSQGTVTSDGNIQNVIGGNNAEPAFIAEVTDAGTTGTKKGLLVFRDNAADAGKIIYTHRVAAVHVDSMEFFTAEALVLTFDSSQDAVFTGAVTGAAASFTTGNFSDTLQVSKAAGIATVSVSAASGTSYATFVLGSDATSGALAREGSAPSYGGAARDLLLINNGVGLRMTYAGTPAVTFPGSVTGAAASFTTGAFSGAVDVTGKLSGLSVVSLERAQIGVAGVINDAAGVFATCQFGNGPTAFLTGHVDAYIYKTPSVIGTLGSHTLIIQSRQDNVAGFAYVGGATPTVAFSVHPLGAGYFRGILTVSDETDTSGVGTGALRVAGGLDIAKKLYVTTSISSAFPSTDTGTGLLVTTNDGSVQEIKRDSSSARWKTDIENAVIDPAKVLGIMAKEYGRESQEGRRFTGFIVEDFDKAGFKNIIDYDKDGLPTGFLEFGRGITALHHVVLQHHDRRIGDNTIALQEAQHRIEVLETQVELLETAIAEA